MIMAVLDFVLLQINSLSYSFYNHSLFRILKVFKSMRALRAIRVLRRLRSLPPRLFALVWRFSKDTWAWISRESAVTCLWGGSGLTVCPLACLA